MRQRALLCMLGLLALVSAPAWSQSRTYFGFELDYRNAPPPPRIYFRQAPRTRYVSSSQVYVVTDVDRYGVDMFRYGGYWYVTRDGYWYRSRNYRGPFYAVSARQVPDRVYSVPMVWWHHHPRGDWRASNGDRNHDRGDSYGRDRYGRDRYDRGAGYSNNVRDTYFGFHLDVSNAPAPPRVWFRGQPDAMYVPETGVYVVQDADYDMFRYGDYWYVGQGGYWYRGDTYRGPFVAISARSVPSAIYDTPDRYWRDRPMRDDRD
jgi:hypothetical protein